MKKLLALKLGQVLAAVMVLGLGTSMVFAQGSPGMDTDQGSRGMPSWSGDQGAVPEADNTRTNKRFRMGEGTADQQAMSADNKVIANIRSKIVDDDNLSSEAHNVKIITQRDGKIFLRGPVRSENEKQTVERLAREASEGRPVVNQLEVTNR